jgi:hypothetical protein
MEPDACTVFIRAPKITEVFMESSPTATWTKFGEEIDCKEIPDCLRVKGNEGMFCLRIFVFCAESGSEYSDEDVLISLIVFHSVQD